MALTKCTLVAPDMAETHTGVCCESFYCMHNILNVKAKVVISKSFHFYISQAIAYMQISPLNAALVINNIQYMASSDSNVIVQLMRMTVLSFLAVYPANQEFALVGAGVQQRNFPSLVKGKKSTPQSPAHPSPPEPWVCCQHHSGPKPHTNVRVTMKKVNSTSARPSTLQDCILFSNKLSPMEPTLC